MPRVIEKTVYRFNELSEEAKARARDDHRYQDVEYGDWWGCIYEDAVHMAALMGIAIDTNKTKGPEIFFSGFGSQDSGASFEGRYACKPDAAAAIKSECNDKELIAIAEELNTLQVRCMMTWGTTITCVITARRDTSIEVSDVYWRDDSVTEEDSDDQDLGDELQTLMRRFADWIYKSLETEHDYLTSDEHGDERLSESDDEFDEDGSII